MGRMKTKSSQSALAQPLRSWLPKMSLNTINTSQISITNRRNKGWYQSIDLHQTSRHHEEEPPHCSGGLLSSSGTMVNVDTTSSPSFTRTWIVEPSLTVPARSARAT